MDNPSTDEDSTRKFISTLLNERDKVKKINDEYLHFNGLPPSHVITFPSLECDGMGLDEKVILKNWYTALSDTGFQVYSTNCSWAMKSVLKPVFESFCQIPADFKIIPWAPADIVALAKKAKKEFLKENHEFYSKVFQKKNSQKRFNFKKTI